MPGNTLEYLTNIPEHLMHIPVIYETMKIIFIVIID